MRLLVDLVNMFGVLFGTAWMWCSVILHSGLARGNNRRIINGVWITLKYPAVVAFIMFLILDGYHFWDKAASLSNIAFWWFFRNSGDDDDRWRRLRNKARGLVTRLGNRLTVAPEPGNA